MGAEAVITASAMSSSSSSHISSSFPEFTAVVLACSVGTRLFPLTSIRHPKHLLPIVGVPILHRLLRAIQSTGFTQCVVAIQSDDAVTIPSLQELVVAGDETSERLPIVSQVEENYDNDENILSTTSSSTFDRSIFSFQLQNCHITVIRLNEHCSGSGDALRQMESMQQQQQQQQKNGSFSVLHPSSHIVLFPGDLVVLDDQPLKTLIQEHRQGNNTATRNQKGHLLTACTVLLTDVCETDENGVPLKESAKQKKGGLARDEEEIEYIALSYDRSNNNSITGPRLISKQPKIDVEEDVHMTGATPKFTLPKQRLSTGTVQVGLDWNDVHVYVLSPWVRQLIVERASTVLAIRDDLLPLMVSRQYKGITATFGSALPREDRNEKLVHLLKHHSSSKQQHQSYSSSSAGAAGEYSHTTNDPDHSHGHDFSKDDESLLVLKQEYAVRATVAASSVFRSHTVPSYLYANREFLNVALHNHASRQHFLDLAPQTETNTKFQSVVLPGATIGEKVTFKSTVVGRGCKIGHKCRLNNVVLVEDVEIGENTILQNTVVASQARIAENCNLNDCQVGPGHSLPAGTKAKVESFAAVDSDDALYN